MRTGICCFVKPGVFQKCLEREEEFPRKPPQTANSQKEGQSELRGKPHRSNRCSSFAAYEDRHLRRREDRPTGSELDHEWQRLCWFTEQLTLAFLRSHSSNWTNPKKNGETPVPRNPC